MQEIFKSRTSIIYFLNEENDIPLVIAQSLLLSMITSIILPIAFKAFSRLIYGSLHMFRTKGFDQ